MNVGMKQMRPEEMLQILHSLEDPHSQRGGIFVFYSSKPRMFVSSSQSSGSYLKPPQKVLGMMGDCREFAMDIFL